MPAEAFDSLAKFLAEHKIEFLQEAESQFEVAKQSDHRFRIIAVVGLFDKGVQFNIKDTVFCPICFCLLLRRKTLKERHGC